jgi:hypothetical protein
VGQVGLAGKGGVGIWMAISSCVTSKRRKQKLGWKVINVGIGKLFICCYTHYISGAMADQSETATSNTATQQAAQKSKSKKTTIFIYKQTRDRLKTSMERESYDTFINRILDYFLLKEENK